jgi:glycerol kinase
MAQHQENHRFILAVDQGTTGSAAFIFDHDGRVVASADREITQHYPEPGWVSHDPEELFQSILAVSREAMSSAGILPSQIAAMGITNQRETTVVWDRATGQPVGQAVVWQCRRTAPLCQQMALDGMDSLVSERTGLVIDPYFSGTKIRWLLDHTEDGQKRGEAGELCAGTVDSWLLHRFTGGRVHATDITNAARTMLFNIHTGTWDDDLLEYLRIPTEMLPKVQPSSSNFGETEPSLFGSRIPITCLAGDQHAALFGQACYQPGMVKNTYGTGSFLLMQTGQRPVASSSGLLTTIAWQQGTAQVQYALEGSIFNTGSAVQWLRDGLGIIGDASETEAMAESVPDTGGVFFVPAFTGLGAPYWDAEARGTITGLTRGTNRAHIVRATLESIAYQVRDVVEAMESDTGLRSPVLRADGGGSANAFLMQFQADQLGVPVEVPEVAETTALGAAYLAGLAVGFWENQETVSRQWQLSRRYEPRMDPQERDELYSGWKRAVERSRG